MRCYTRYIIRTLVLPVLLVTSTLTGIIWLTQALRFIDMIVNRGLNVTTFLYLSSLLLPSLLMVIMPIALFCAVTFVYYRLIMDSELIALKSAGLSKLELAKPALMVSGVAMLLGYLLSLYLLPASYREFKDMQLFIRDNYASLLLQEGVFNSPLKGLTVYIDQRADNGMLRGILVHDSRIPERPVTMMAQEGQLLQTTAGPRFDLINGNRQEIDRKNNELSLLYFERYTLDLSAYTQAETSRWREAKERYLSELFFPVDTPEHLKASLRAEGHQRLLWPINNISLALVAMAILFSGQFNRRGQWKRILIACSTMVVALVAQLALFNVAADTPAVIPLLYGITAAMVFGSILAMLDRKPRFLTSPTLLSGAR